MARWFKISNDHTNGNSSSAESKQWYQNHIFLRSCLGFVFLLVTILLFPQAESFKFADLKEGNISTEEIIAPFTFRVQKNPAELRSEREDARRQVLPVFHHTESTLNNSQVRLKALQDSLRIVLSSSLVDSLKDIEIERIISENEIILTKDLNSFFIHLSRGELIDDQYQIDFKGYDQYFDQLGSIVADILVFGICNIPKSEIPNYENKITVIRSDQETQKSRNEFYEIEEAQDRLLERMQSQYVENSDSVKVGYALLESLLSTNLIYDPDQTDLRINEAIAQVPLIKGRILKSERIVDSNERVTSEQVDIIRSLAMELREREKKSGILSIILLWFGKILLIIGTQIPMLLFLYFYRRRIWNDLRMMFIITLSMLFVVIVAAIAMFYGAPKFLIPFATVPLIVISYQDTRTGLFVGLSLSFLIGAQFGLDFEIALIGMIVSSASIISFGLSKYRKRLVNATIILALAYLLGITAAGILRFISLNDLGLALAGALGAAIFSPILAYVFIMLFDYVFDVASEFKLIELSDLNNPLLKMMAMRSPGSYHHSLQVSNLTEAGAESIGANALLAKVGAYYHDLGKMFMPEYFVENQLGGKNPHDRLSPRLSSLILINHVRKGYDFAKENKIPTVVTDFILEHHGQSLMKFFYEKAKDGAKSKNIDILESDFRYPGNRPKTRETGILMLADSVEAMVRSIKEPNLGKIRNGVRNIVVDKIHSGDLDDCPLTVKELSVIIETFSNILTGIHHDRVEYPGQKKMTVKGATPKRVMAPEGQNT